MNVESRYSGRVFEVAGGMLKTSLDAKVAKMDKKLKMIELQLKKEKLDQDTHGWRYCKRRRICGYRSK